MYCMLLSTTVCHTSSNSSAILNVTQVARNDRVSLKLVCKQPTRLEIHNRIVHAYVYLINEPKYYKYIKN